MKCKSDGLLPNAVVLASVFVALAQSESRSDRLLCRLPNPSSQKGGFLFSRPRNT